MSFTAAMGSSSGNRHQNITIDTNPKGSGLQSSVSFNSGNWQTPKSMKVTVGSQAQVSSGVVYVRFSYAAGASEYSGFSDDVGVNVVVPVPVVSVSNNALTLTEGGSGTTSVSLDIQPDRDLTVRITQVPAPNKSANPDVTFSPSEMTFTSANWAAQTLTVRAAHDDDNADEDTAYLALSRYVDGQLLAGDVTRMSVDINDDDFAATITEGCVTISGTAGQGSRVLNSNCTDSVEIIGRRTTSIAGGDVVSETKVTITRGADWTVAGDSSGTVLRSILERGAPAGQRPGTLPGPIDVASQL